MRRNSTSNLHTEPPALSANVSSVPRSVALVYKTSCCCETQQISRVVFNIRRRTACCKHRTQVKTRSTVLDGTPELRKELAKREGSRAEITSAAASGEVECSSPKPSRSHQRRPSAAPSRRERMARAVPSLHSSRQHVDMGLLRGGSLGWVVQSRLTQQTPKQGVTSTVGPHQQQHRHRHRQLHPQRQRPRKGSTALGFSRGVGGVEPRQQV